MVYRPLPPFVANPIPNAGVPLGSGRGEIGPWRPSTAVNAGLILRPAFARIEVMTRSRTERAWTVPPASLVLAGLVCVAVSTQFLFQGSIHRDWPMASIVSAWAGNLWQAMLVATVMLAVLVLAGRAPLRNAAARLAGLGIALLAGAYLGEWLLLWLQWGTRPAAGVEAILPRAIRWVPIAAVGGLILTGRQRVRELSSRFHEIEVSRLQLDKEQVALQLQLLRSQIEPHFLFNTLATVRHLQRTDPARGQETLTGFIRYLKASLPAMRASETTLGQELDLVQAYLAVLQVRMGDRLRFDIDVAPGLRDERVPPFSVATLVENAIKHGLAELPDGGSISISAWRDGCHLGVKVSDTGNGLAATSGTGTGLANLRARLRGLYGEDGKLSLAANSPSGLVATLQVPLPQPTVGGGRDAA